VRPDVVPVLGAPRNSEILALLEYRHRRFRAESNAAVAAITNVALGLHVTAGILNEKQVEWLLEAFESDRQELSRAPARRPKAER
jgi:hypothetical protein